MEVRYYVPEEVVASCVVCHFVLVAEEVEPQMIQHCDLVVEVVPVLDLEGVEAPLFSPLRMEEAL